MYLPVRGDNFEKKNEAKSKDVIQQSHIILGGKSSSFVLYCQIMRGNRLHHHHFLF